MLFICFIECGYHTSFIIWRFWVFRRKYLILEHQISEYKWEKYEPSINTNISKNFR